MAPDGEGVVVTDPSHTPAASARPLDSASPRSLWLWAWSIVLIGITARLLWFYTYKDELPTLGTILSGHLWSLNVAPPPGSSELFDPFAAARAFAPGYGALLRGLIELTGHAADPFAAFVWGLATLQSLMVAAATLVTFALSRRVLFGYWALAPAALMTSSVALLELPGGIAAQIPLMLALVLVIWLLTLLRERAPGLAGARALLLTLASGLMIGACVLLDPACLLLAPLLIWWAFRGIGRDHAILLLVAALLLPACWLALVQSQTSGGIPTQQIERWAGQNERVANSGQVALDRAYAVVTVWNPRFARGAWQSDNFNYEWLLPFSVRGETTYTSATRALAAVWMLLYLALVLGGVCALWLEGAGSAARLIALPILSLPLATFVTTTGGLLRVAILPFLMIAICLGLAWLVENASHSKRKTVKPA